MYQKRIKVRKTRENKKDEVLVKFREKIKVYERAQN